MSFALDYAAGHDARIVNMSFAGPKDPLIERAITAVAMHNIVMVAAAGNAGAKSPPHYPAANPNVIAVSAIQCVQSRRLHHGRSPRRRRLPAGVG